MRFLRLGILDAEICSEINHVRRCGSSKPFAGR